MKRIAIPLFVSALFVLPSCAQQFLTQAQNECSGFGFTPGTTEYATCVQQQYAAGRLRMQQGLMNAGRTMSQPSLSEPTYGGAAAGTGFLKGSHISGMNRICVYDRLGSAYAITIGAAEICPLTAP